MYDHKLSFFRLNKNINMWCCRSCELIELIDKIMTMDQNEKANIKGVIKRNIKFSFLFIDRSSNYNPGILWCQGFVFQV